MRTRIMADRLDRTKGAETLRPNEAPRLQRVDLRSSKGIVARGKGFSRVDFTTGETTTINAVGSLRQRNGTAILIFSTATGDWKAHVKPSSAYTDANY